MASEARNCNDTVTRVLGWVRELASKSLRAWRWHLLDLCVALGVIQRRDSKKFASIFVIMFALAGLAELFDEVLWQERGGNGEGGTEIISVRCQGATEQGVDNLAEDCVLFDYRSDIFVQLILVAGRDLINAKDDIFRWLRRGVLRGFSLTGAVRHLGSTVNGGIDGTGDGTVGQGRVFDFRSHHAGTHVESREGGWIGGGSSWFRILRLLMKDSYHQATSGVLHLVNIERINQPRH